MSHNSSNHINVYDLVSSRILDSLKHGTIPWQKPWTVPQYPGGSSPRNFRTGKPYRGVNILLLWSAPCSSPFWLTFRQAQELRGSVRKGETGTRIVFYKQLNGSKNTEKTQKEEMNDEKPSNQSPFVLAHYTVFNVEQCDGLKLPELVPAEAPNDVEIDATCEALVNAWQGRPTLQVTSLSERRAYYRPATDTVHLPARFRFREAALYYSTLFHELVHSTGHENRLNRTFGASFGDELYSKEEMVAELGAAFLCAFTGIANQNTEENTTSYLQHWIAQLEADNHLILQAASAAQKAVDLITADEKEVAQ